MAARPSPNGNVEAISPSAWFRVVWEPPAGRGRAWSHASQGAYVDRAWMPHGSPCRVTMYVICCVEFRAPFSRRGEYSPPIWILSAETCTICRLCSCRAEAPRQPCSMPRAFSVSCLPRDAGDAREGPSISASRDDPGVGSNRLATGQSVVRHPCRGIGRAIDRQPIGSRPDRSNDKIRAVHSAVPARSGMPAWESVRRERMEAPSRVAYGASPHASATMSRAMSHPPPGR